MKLLIVGIALVAASGVAAAVYTYEMANVDEPPLGTCQAGSMQAPGAGFGTLRFVIDNEGPTSRVVICAISTHLERVIGQTIEIPGGTVSTIDLPVPVGAYFAGFETPKGGPINAAAMGGIAYLRTCLHWAAQFKFELGPGIGSGGDGSGDCIDPGRGAPTKGALDLAVGRLTDGRPADRALGAGVGTSMLTGGVLLLRVPLHFGFLLFTRLQRPRVLEQGQRARIHELVNAEPGIHGNAIAQRLGLSRGETLYHLHVLVREGMLSRVENWGLRSFFVPGQLSPKEMRSTAALRSPPLRRLYGAVEQNPGVPLPNIAQAAGYSLGRTSRLARRLEEVGLIDRIHQGRTVLLRPRGTAPGPAVVGGAA